MTHPEDEGVALAEPRSPFQQCLRDLATAAMSVTHHDAAETESGYIHEVQAMERRFSPIILGYMSRRRNAQGGGQ